MIARKRSPVVVVAIDPSWPFKHHHSTIHGIMRYARERDWDCLLDPFVGGRRTRSAAGFRVDGIIARAGKSLAAYVRRAGIPAVNVWNGSPDRSLPRVVSDMAGAGRMAADHLLGRGFSRFGFIGGRDPSSMGELEGFRTALLLAGLPCSSLTVPLDSLDQWIRGWVFPMGLFASYELVARLLVGVCRRRGIRIPDDVGVVCTGNTELVCEMFEPTITSIEQGFENVGYKAAQMLDRIMKGGRPPAEPVLVPPVAIVERGSTSAFAVGDPDLARVMKTVWSPGSRDLRVRDLLAGFPGSRRTLERRFRETLGRTLHQEIQRARIDRARKLLSQTLEPLKGVAKKSGFRSPAHFSRVFRSQEGMSPSAYRLGRRS
jgi:LacI family transcriptional regulator